MNFDEAIKVHTYWKVTLRWMINGHRPVDEIATADPHRCELGQWIDAEGALHADLPEYQVLQREHAEFHEVAAAVIHQIQCGWASAADAMLAPDGAFTLASARTVEAIRALQSRVAQGQGR